MDYTGRPVSNDNEAKRREGHLSDMFVEIFELRWVRYVLKREVSILLTCYSTPGGDVITEVKINPKLSRYLAY